MLKLPVAYVCALEPLLLAVLEVFAHSVTAE